VPGLDYAHVVETNQPWSIHIARLERNRKDFRLTSLLAQDMVEGLATVAEQVQAANFNRARPVLAVNGDFFEIRDVPYRGDPEGLHICRGELVSLGAHPAFWVDRSGGWQIGEVSSQAEIIWPNGRSSPLELNGPVRSNRPALFTPTFGPSTRATNAMEFVLAPANKGPWLPLRANQTLTARVQEIRYHGNSPLPANQIVLAVDPAYVPSARLVKPGDVLRLSTDLTPNFSRVDTALGGWPILVSRDPAREWKLWSRRSNLRHPRTGIGFNERHLFLVVVDGRLPWVSMGMTLPELAELMRQLGCTDALNLDGGGSSTFWLRGDVLNFPSDFLARRVANALVILQKVP
jgi:large repetitive protein